MSSKPKLLHQVWWNPKKPRAVWIYHRWPTLGHGTTSQKACAQKSRHGNTRFGASESGRSPRVHGFGRYGRRYRSGLAGNTGGSIPAHLKAVAAEALRLALPAPTALAGPQEPPC